MADCGSQAPSGRRRSLTRLLGVDDDLEFREAVRALRLSQKDEPTDSSPEAILRRAKAQKLLQQVSTDDPDRRRRSRALSLLSVLMLSTPSADQEERATTQRIALANLQKAIETDPTNDEAKYNLEAVLRRRAGVQTSAGRSDTGPVQWTGTIARGGDWPARKGLLRSAPARAARHAPVPDAEGRAACAPRPRAARRVPRRLEAGNERPRGAGRARAAREHAPRSPRCGRRGGRPARARGRPAARRAHVRPESALGRGGVRRARRHPFDARSAEPARSDAHRAGEAGRRAASRVASRREGRRRLDHEPGAAAPLPERRPGRVPRDALQGARRRSSGARHGIHHRARSGLEPQRDDLQPRSRAWGRRASSRPRRASGSWSS